MLVVFEKGELLRHIGHLDLMRAMQRALRRAGLPVAYSQGFNPHMVMNFASPLSVGAAGTREIMDVGLAQEMDGETFAARLNDALPPALRVAEARLIEDNHPAPMSLLRAAAYEMLVDEPAGETLAQSIPAFLQKESIPAMRKTKSGDKPCDIRPMIYELSARKVGEASLFFATLALREEATLKPDLLMTSLSQECGIDCPGFSLKRVMLYGQGPDGGLVPLQSL
jgi:radical SAM-linked protein